MDVQKSDAFRHWIMGLADGEADMRRNRRARLKTTPWDVTEYLTDDKSIAGYLEAVLEEGDPKLIASALGDVARAKGMSEVARKAGLGRESLYKGLSKNGNPEFATVVGVLKSLGLRLRVTPTRRTRKAAGHET